MAPNRDYYELLGVPRDADAKQIKRAFLKKARELHPDVSDAPDAEERFKEVNEAYSVLSDEQRRQNYDRFGDPNGPSGFGGDYVDISDIFGGFGMGDIFSSFFGGSAGGRPQRTRGRDMGITLRITLAEAAAGCTKTIAYDRLAPCDDCGGSGMGEGGSAKTCEQCHGTGRVVTVQRTILGQMQTQATCPACGGSGTVIDTPCETCQGQGRAPSRERVDIEIPAGIRSGHRLSVSGMGEAGVRGEAAGDLVVSVAIADDERFVRQNDDLACRLDIDAFQAMLGCTVEQEGILEGEVVTVEVPAGAQNGQRIVVEGHGMPRLGMEGRGRLVCVLEVSVPEDLGEDERKALEELSRAYHAAREQDSTADADPQKA